MTTIAYPNGQVLTSTALTIAAINAALQPLTCSVLGMPAPDYSQVRIDWATAGQPFEDVNADVCYLGCLLTDDPYTLIRDQYLSQTGGVLTQSWTYTRAWRVSWTLYGPNSFDRARAIHSALFMDAFTDSLSESNLFPLPNMPLPRRVPELLNAQWWERADFYCNMYEAVTETISPGIATSVEIKVDTNEGQVADITVG